MVAGFLPLSKGKANFVCEGGIPFEREMSQRDKRIAVLQGGRPPLGDGICLSIVRHGLYLMSTFGLFGASTNAPLSWMPEPKLGLIERKP